VVLPPRWWAAQARYTLAFFLKNRLRDRAGVISFAWAMLNTGDDFAAAFGDRYVDYGGAIRLLGGDNRPLPVKPYPGIGWSRRRSRKTAWRT
jgi:hypothetical protein